LQRRGRITDRIVMAMRDTSDCPKSDEGIKSAVKQGAIVCGIGKPAVKLATSLRDALGRRCHSSSDDWEGSKVNHLVIIVECMPMNGDCCEAANKFMRQVRASDGYGVYSNIIGRQVAILALGKMGKVSGAAKVEDTLLKRGGCKRLVPRIGVCPAEGPIPAAWLAEISAALDATMSPAPPPEPMPAPSPAPPVDIAPPVDTVQPARPPVACAPKPVSVGEADVVPYTKLTVVVVAVAAVALVGMIAIRSRQ